MPTHVCPSVPFEPLSGQADAEHAAGHGSYAAFKPLDDGSGTAMVMGDLALLDEEVPGVMSTLFDDGLDVTALHNHLNRVSPRVMSMHSQGMGDPVRLASNLHTALGASNTPLGRRRLLRPLRRRPARSWMRTCGSRSSATAARCPTACWP